MAGDNGVLQRFSAQINKAVLESQLFVGQFRPFELKRRCLAGAVDRQFVNPNFDLTRRQLGIDEIVAAVVNIATNLNHIFSPQFSGSQVNFRVIVCTENDLCFSIAVSKIDENQLFPLLAVAIHPAAQSDGLIDMVTTQFAAGMSSKHSWESEMCPLWVDNEVAQHDC